LKAIAMMSLDTLSLESGQITLKANEIFQFRIVVRPELSKVMMAFEIRESLKNNEKVLLYRVNIPRLFHPQTVIFPEYFPQPIAV
jgi:hypothetical protein